MCAAGGQSERGVQGPWLPVLRPGGEGTWAKQGPLPSCPEKEAGKELWGASLQVCVCVCGHPRLAGDRLLHASRGRARSSLHSALSAMPTPGHRSPAAPCPRRAQGPTRQAPPSLRLIVTMCLRSDRRKEIWVLVWQNPHASTQQPSTLINPVRNVGQDAVHIISYSRHTNPPTCRHDQPCFT